MPINMKSAMLAGALLGAAMISTAPAKAQVPAFLPMVEEVEKGEATTADGTYIVSTINKRITIENGRAYVVDPWTHALILKVKPGMVTLRNFRQTGANTFEADDLPMMGKVVFNRQPDGTLEGIVKGALGEAKYNLVPAELTIAPVDDGQNVIPPPEPVAALPRIYQLHISGGECRGSSLLRKRYNGVAKISVTDSAGDKLESKNRNFSVRCTDKGPRSQNYKFYDNGPAALTITVPPGEDGVSDLRIRGTIFDPLGALDFYKPHDALTKAHELGRDLKVNESFSEWHEWIGGKASMNFEVTIKRVQ
ncbi:hypothetical protein [Erythrobacter sp. F6033]|uniref:hypothetical protein n=1 Tax=Erythrobacter sp. F6033 TaxID=2926401 RepID=UPI001FF10E48|nr:hypothetical protein [Erythrobacter sp. F6033]MCK0129362.1 hypothetical protein [Erythrobacter sp. F6033]